jgi:hypothetical protein
MQIMLASGLRGAYLMPSSATSRRPLVISSRPPARSWRAPDACGKALSRTMTTGPFGAGVLELGGSMHTPPAAHNASINFRLRRVLDSWAILIPRELLGEGARRSERQPSRCQRSDLMRWTTCSSSGALLTLALRKSLWFSNHRRFDSSSQRILCASNVDTPAASRRTMRPFCRCTMRRASATCTSTRERLSSKLMWPMVSVH